MQNTSSIRKQEKRTFFERVRKWAMIGVLSAGIITTSTVGLKAEYMDWVRRPPNFSFLKKEHKKGGDYLFKAYERSDAEKLSGGLYDKAINYFEKEVEKDKDNINLFYTLNYCYYAKVLDADSPIEAQTYLEKAIKLAEEGYEKAPEEKKVWFLDLKALSIRSIGYSYYNWTKHGYFIYRRNAIEYLNRFLNLYEMHKEELDKFDKDYSADLVESAKKYLKELEK